MANITDYRTITYFDVETTSLDPSKGEIIQICILTEDREGKLEEWSTKIRPRLQKGTYSREALRINNFDPKQYIDAPIFEDVADTIIDKLRWGPIVAKDIQAWVSCYRHCFACLFVNPIRKTKPDGTQRTLEH